MRIAPVKPTLLAGVLLASGLLCGGTTHAQTYSRIETIAYHDNTTAWVLGQVASETCTASVPASTACDGDVVRAVTFDATTALPLTVSSFGKLQQTLTYSANGTLATSKDGNNNTTTFSNWKRGLPQSIQYADSTTQSAVVNDAGWITSFTDENGYRTCYAYDAMGRVSQVTWPSESVAGVCDASTWTATTQAFVQVNTAEHGIPAGHWRQTVATGNARKVTYYDALWRPLIVREYDTANESGTQRFNNFAYNHRGQVTFAAYPATVHNASTGTHTGYDALARPASVAQDSELGTLTTAYAYLSGFQTRITDPKGNQTTTGYLAWDQPVTDFPVLIAHPEVAWTHITRDAFGKPTRIRRSDSSSPTAGSLAVNRDYVYDGYQQLCKQIEPETASTVLEYDGAGNVAWSASGQALPSTSSCDRPSVVAGQKATRTWDGRNRLTALGFSDGNGSQAWTYTPDGLPASVTTWNDAGASTVVNSYTYNRRRLLTGETQNQTAGPMVFTVGYSYNANAHLSSHLYPGGQTVAYAPNALGQPTQAGTYATGVQYFPNGAMKSFSYGNGVTHTLTQNARQLPLRSLDSGDTVDMTFSYDANGNVTAVADGTSTARQTRSMTYDGQDRLLTASSPMYPGGATYAYDVLDNLTRVTVSGRDHRYVYSSNRLSQATNGPGGPVAMSLGYDVRGNLASRGADSYTFDYGNRLRSALGTQFYRYDAHGRRVRTVSGGANLYETYASNGQLLWQHDGNVGFNFQHVYLNGSVVALHRRPNTPGGPGEALYYWHTDVQGSGVAITMSAGVAQTSEYEPYGKLLNRPNINRIGYTGHVMDAGTGLTYMQQRYYDPQLGIFYSVDPMAVDTTTGWNFCRYCYAANNPYKYKDPDGRFINFVVGFAIGAGIDATMQVVGSMRDGQSFGDAVSNIDVGDVVVAGAVSAIIPGLGNVAKSGYQGAKVAVPAAKAIAKVAAKSANTANRAAKNSAAITRNLGKIEGAAADAGKATVTAAAHQLVKADAQSRTPEVTVSDVRDAVKPPPPPPPQDERLK